MGLLHLFPLVGFLPWQKAELDQDDDNNLIS